MLDNATGRRPSRRGSAGDALCWLPAARASARRFLRPAVVAPGGDSKPKESSGLISAPVDTSKTAKRGGVLKASANTDVPTFDAFTVSVPNRQPVLGGYSRLLQLKPGYMQGATGEVIGDLGESWELAPDRSTLTFKLRQGALNAPVAPVNGRAMDAQDVLYSWNRFAQVGTARATLVNTVDAERARDVGKRAGRPDASCSSSTTRRRRC